MNKILSLILSFTLFSGLLSILHADDSGSETIDVTAEIIPAGRPGHPQVIVIAKGETLDTEYTATGGQVRRALLPLVDQTVKLVAEVEWRNPKRKATGKRITRVISVVPVK